LIYKKHGGVEGMNHIYAYIRVSSKDQNTDRQEQAIEEYCKQEGISINRIFTDKASGKDFNREAYLSLKGKLRAGDLIIVKELDRLGRNMDMIKTEWHDMTSSGVDIVVIDTPILNTTKKTDLEKTLISNIVFELLSYMAEKERHKTRQRQREGIDALRARNKGKGIGRPKAEIPEDFLKEYRDYKAGNYGDITATKFAKMIGIGRSTLYKYVKQLETEHIEPI
jgi:DNA invertase Pin-like site-specific DNA recombinase